MFEVDKGLLIHRTGVDTYVSYGQRINELTVHPAQRTLFFSENKHIKPLLLREKTNPLVEEGKYQHGSREREGELYLTYEALTLLVEKKIRMHKPKRNGLTYNSRNIFIIKNDAENLHKILLNIEFTINNDAKIIYISGIHSIPFYLRNEGGRIKCFIVDSEAGVQGYPVEIITAVKSIFPDADITLSSTTLQKDFYSCSTFAVKTLMYFVKHGHELFAYLDQAGTTQKTVHGHNCFTLPPNKLMPTLLKMSQSQLTLSDGALGSIVSHKKNTTLAKYLEEHTLNINEKSMNAAALLKKYKYFNELDTYINHCIENNTISADPHIALLPSLEKRHTLYARAPSSKKKCAQEHPVDVYLDIIHLCEGEKVEPATKYCFKQLEIITEKYPGFIKEFQGASSSWARIEQNRCLTRQLLFVACYVEDDYYYDIPQYRDFADNLHSLFNSFTNVLTYLKAHANLTVKKPIHDASLIYLPREAAWDKDYWSNLVLSHGHTASKYLRLAPYIDNLLKENVSRRIESKCLNDIVYIEYLLKNIQYKQAMEHPQLASLCIKHLRSEKDFEKCLKIVQNELKTLDLLPDITIKGEEIGSQYSKYLFSKLPVDDLRGLFLGEYTACCQSFGKQGSSCAINGMTSLFSGFYVLYNKDGDIIAQTWAWIGQQGEIVFDSWEYINKEQTHLAKPFLKKAAELMLQAGFTKIHIGDGDKTPDMDLLAVKELAVQRVTTSYSDAWSQNLLKENLPLTTLERFINFAKQNNLSDPKFIHLIDKIAEKYDFVIELADLIANHNLTFDEFISLIKFTYITTPYTENIFLHDNHPTNQMLLKNAFKAYGNKLQLLMPLKNNQAKTLFETIITFADLEFFKQCIECVYSHLSWDKVAAMKNSKGLSVLFFAAKQSSTECFDFLVSKINDDTLTTLLEQTDPDDGAILHLMQMYLQQHCLLVPLDLSPI